jgi:hypothetical protein
MKTAKISRDNFLEIDLGNSAEEMTITAKGNAEVHIDYALGTGAYSSAIKGSAGYPNPFNLPKNASKIVKKADLESEHVRVGVRKADISVTWEEI